MNATDLFRQFLDAGMQFTQLTQQRAEAIVRDLVRTGEVQTEQAQSMVNEFVDRSRENTEKFFELVRAEIQQQLKTLGVVTKSDLARVERRASKAAAASSASTPSSAASPSTSASKKSAATTSAKKSTAKKSTAKKASPTAKKSSSTAKKSSSTAKKSSGPAKRTARSSAKKASTTAKKASSSSSSS